MVKFNELQIRNVSGVPTITINVSVLSGDAFRDVFIRKIIVIKASDYTSSLDPETSTSVTPLYTKEFNTFKDFKKYGSYDESIQYNSTKSVTLDLTAVDFLEDVDLSKDVFMVYVYTGTMKSFIYDGEEITLEELEKDWKNNPYVPSLDPNGDSHVDYLDAIYYQGMPEDTTITWSAPNTHDQVCCTLNKNYDMGMVFNICRVYNAIIQNIRELDCNRCEELPLNLSSIYLNYMSMKYSIMTCNYEDAIYRYNKMFNNTRSYNSVVSTGCGCGK